MNTGISMKRRSLLAAALAAGVAVPLGGGAGRALAAPPRLSLPKPTGPHKVGIVDLKLVDKSRPGAGTDRYRELMVSVWYPAAGGRYPVSPWLQPEPTRDLLANAGFDPDSVLAPWTSGHVGAPVARTGEKLPVVLYSHGAHDHRSDTTNVVQKLASHGYVVVTVDHTYDAFVEFPDGRVLVPVDDPVMLPPDFARDVRFVLDCVEDPHRLPADLRAAVDLDRVGVFGWSKGGTAAALAMMDDERFRAGFSFDGPMISDPPPATDLYRPFMVVSAVNTRDVAPAVAEFWSHLRGWRLNILATGAVHSSYCDQQWLIPQLARVIDLDEADLLELIGTLDPARAVRIVQAYPLAFFDLHLRHRGHLLDGPSPAFPEVQFLP